MVTYRNNSANMYSVLTDASFRAWIQDFVTMLDNSGWTRASDTGMLDETTVTLPGIASTYAGYQIWYLDDSLHATYPIYVRFGFGRGSTTTRLLFNAQVGYATNGTGNLSGWTSSVFQLATTQSTVNATGVNMGSGGEGYAWWVNGRGIWSTVPQSFVFSLQREFDTTNNVVNNGNWALLMLAHGLSATTYQMVSVNRAYATVYGPSNAFCMTPFGTTQSGSATETELWRHFVKFPQVANCGASATYMSGDIQIDAPFAADITGAIRTWLPTGIGLCSIHSDGNHMFAGIWE